MPTPKNARIIARNRVLFWAVMAIGIGIWAALLIEQIREAVTYGTAGAGEWVLIGILGILLAGVIVVGGPLMVDRKKRR
jgi:hypothetical protein